MNVVIEEAKINEIKTTGEKLNEKNGKEQDNNIGSKIPSILPINKKVTK